jgi:hypothetical protein
VKRNQWLLLVLVVLAWFNAGTVWLIHFSCYPLWRDVGPDAFATYFQLWQQSTWTVVFLPFALSAVGALLLLIFAWSEIPRSLLWLGVALQVAIEFVRSFLLSPMERQAALLFGQPETQEFRQLIATNWLLICLVTAYALLTFGMLVHALWPSAKIGRSHLLLSVTSALGLYAVGNIWFVQLVSYRLWPYVARNEAFAYHIAWWHSIWGVLFIPAGVVLLGSLAMLRFRPDGVSRRTGRISFALQLLVYVLTGAWFGPLMARLATADAGLSLPLYHLLMTTHWVRLLLFTAYGAVCCYMLVRSAIGSEWKPS